MTVADHRTLLEHIGFVSHRVMTDDFRDSAHTDYTCAICKLVQNMGFAAFNKANMGVSITYYGPQSMEAKKYAHGSYNACRRVLHKQNINTCTHTHVSMSVLSRNERTTEGITI